MAPSLPNFIINDKVSSCEVDMWYVLCLFPPSNVFTENNVKKNAKYNEDSLREIINISLKRIICLTTKHNV